jgi:hypothetical protein
MNVYYLVKLGIQLSLFTIFLLMFGIPSLKRYNAKNVLTKREERSLKDLKLPSVTVCPR